jgi:hypothetical protein
MLPIHGCRRITTMVAWRLLSIGLCGLLCWAGAGDAQQAKRGEVNTPPAKGERFADKLEAGDAAPDFTLPDPTGKKQITLSSFKGKKPVVMIFGSYT